MGIPWDGTGINCYGMGMGQISMSHGQTWKSLDSDASSKKSSARGSHCQLYSMIK